MLFSGQFNLKNFRSMLCNGHFKTFHFKPVQYNFRGMFRIIVLLEDQDEIWTFLVDALRCSFSNSCSFFFLMRPSIFSSASVLFPAQNPYKTMLPPPWFTVGMVFFRKRNNNGYLLIIIDKLVQFLSSDHFSKWLVNSFSLPYFMLVLQ